MPYYVLGKYYIEREVYIVEGETANDAIDRLALHWGNGEIAKTQYPDWSDVARNPGDIHLIEGDFETAEDARFFVEKEL